MLWKVGLADFWNLSVPLSWLSLAVVLVQVMGYFWPSGSPGCTPGYGRSTIPSGSDPGTSFFLWFPHFLFHVQATSHLWNYFLPEELSVTPWHVWSVPLLHLWVSLFWVLRSRNAFMEAVWRPWPLCFIPFSVPALLYRLPYPAVSSSWENILTSNYFDFSHPTPLFSLCPPSFLLSLVLSLCLRVSPLKRRWPVLNSKRRRRTWTPGAISTCCWPWSSWSMLTPNSCCTWVPPTAGRVSSSYLDFIYTIFRSSPEITVQCPP